MEEHVREGRDKRGAVVLVSLLVGGEGERPSFGDGIIIPFRLWDFDMWFMLTLLGSWSGNRKGHLMFCAILSCSTIVLIVGFPKGSFCRHLWAILAIVLAALAGNRPFSWGSMISDSLQSSSVGKGWLLLTKFLSSLRWPLSKFFLPVSNSISTIPKLQILALGVGKPLYIVFA